MKTRTRPVTGPLVGRHFSDQDIDQVVELAWAWAEAIHALRVMHEAAGRLVKASATYEGKRLDRGWNLSWLQLHAEASAAERFAAGSLGVLDEQAPAFIRAMVEQVEEG